MQTNEIQELLLDTIPAWHYWFARPFKRMLNDGVSLDTVSYTHLTLPTIA